MTAALKIDEVSENDLLVQALLGEADAARRSVPRFFDFVMRHEKTNAPLKCAPHQRLISLIFSSIEEALTRDIARRMGNILRGLVLQSQFSGITILGPAASPIAKLRDRYRWRLLIRGKDSPKLHRLVHRALERFDTLKLKSKVAITVDVDPQDLL